MSLQRRASCGELVKRLGVLRLCVPVIGLMLASCAATSNGSAAKFAAGGGRSLTANQTAGQFHELSSPENKAVYEQARASSLSEVFNSSLDLVSSEQVQLGGHTFDNLHDLATLHAADLQEIADNYGTVGNMLDAMSITAIADVTPEQMQSYYDLFDDVINRGEAGSSQNDTAANTSTTTSVASSSTSMSHVTTTGAQSIPAGLALAGGFSRSCAVGVGVAAVVTAAAGASCYISMGLACGAAGLASLSMDASAGVACSSGSSQTPAAPKVDTNGAMKGTTAAAASQGAQG